MTDSKPNTCETCDKAYCTSEEYGVLADLVRLCSIDWKHDRWRPHPLFAEILGIKVEHDRLLAAANADRRFLEKELHNAEDQLAVRHPQYEVLQQQFHQTDAELAQIKGRLTGALATIDEKKAEIASYLDNWTKMKEQLQATSDKLAMANAALPMRDTVIAQLCETIKKDKAMLVKARARIKGLDEELDWWDPSKEPHYDAGQEERILFIGGIDKT